MVSSRLSLHVLLLAGSSYALQVKKKDDDVDRLGQVQVKPKL